jgi:anti-sigma regulatory factor (Ser/Thr protein kinase)
MVQGKPLGADTLRGSTMIPGLVAPLHGPVTMRVPFAAESAGRVREALGSWLNRRGSAPRTVDDVRLVATELVGNAVRHARPLGNGTVLVRWHEEGSTLELSVCDGGGTTTPEQVAASPTDVGGRGLAIVDALSSTWWVEHSSDVHTVHALVPLD